MWKIAGDAKEINERSLEHPGLVSTDANTDSDSCVVAATCSHHERKSMDQNEASYPSFGLKNKDSAVDHNKNKDSVVDHNKASPTTSVVGLNGMQDANKNLAKTGKWG